MATTIIYEPKGRAREYAALCACGCGETTRWTRGHWNTFIHGHQSKGVPKTEDHKTHLSMACLGRPSVFKGCHHRDETREIMRQRKLGKPLTSEHRRKIGVSLIGTHSLSGEALAKLQRLAQTPESRRKRSIALQGARSSAWKGGVSTENQILRHSVELKLWRESVFNRDGFTCQRCGAKGVFLHAHHIKSFAEYPALRFEVVNGVTLCKGCHGQSHGRHVA